MKSNTEFALVVSPAIGTSEDIVITVKGTIFNGYHVFCSYGDQGSAVRKLAITLRCKGLTHARTEWDGIDAE